MLTLALTLWACATPRNGAITVRPRVVEVDPEPTRQRRFGALTLLAAYQLSSPHPRFGGLSSLTFGPEPDRLYLLSDRGTWLSARLRLDALGVLQSMGDWSIEPIRDPLGHPVKAPRHDAESLAFHDGSWLMGFEWDHRIWRYPRGLASSRPTLVRLPSAARNAPGNGSLEGMTVLNDGRLLVVCEKYRHPDGTLRGWVGREGAWASVSYVGTNGFAPTDLATLSGSGDVLVLERAFSLLRGNRARVRRVAASTIRAGARLEPTELGRLEPPLVVDNFEGLAVQPHRSTDSVLLYIVSDDNFSRLQQTLLYQFRIKK